MSSPTWKSQCGKRICVPAPRLFKWARSVQDTSLSCSSLEETVPFSWITQNLHPVVYCIFFLSMVLMKLGSPSIGIGLKNTMLVVVFIQACAALQIVSEFVQYHKIQQMVLDQSSPESLQVFLLIAHRHNFGENLMLLKRSIKMCPILCWTCWAWQCGVNMHHHDVVIIISLQTHPAKLVSS